MGTSQPVTPPEYGAGQVELLWLSNLQFLVFRANERDKIVIQHGGQFVDDFGHHERRFRLSGEHFEELDRRLTKRRVASYAALERE